jgi:GPH family glycoside/pentoside/hexuronide:cation symporter
MPAPPPAAPATLALPRAEPAVAQRLALSTIVLYSAPISGLGFMFLFTSMYLMKYATDVLGIAPAAMGLIFLVSRVWDGISDPLAGFLSDRTQTRWGRRRPWLFVGALPVGILFALMWNPPTALEGGDRVLWMGAAVVLFYSATTVFGMPHDSLGAELSTSYLERNRVFGVKRAFFGLGAIPGFAAMGWLASSPDPRGDVAALAVTAAVVTVLLMLVTAVRIRERREYLGRGAKRPLRAIGDVLRNPHARLLLAVFVLQQTAVGCITVMTPYFAQYILGDPSAVTWILGAYFVSSLLAIPFWVQIGHRFEKKSLIVAAMAVIGVALGAIGFLGEGDLRVAIAVICLAGCAGGGLDVLGPSLESDVIDFDEHRTGERKEGVYFATWQLAQKSANGVAGMLVGFLLASASFRPNVAQGESSLLAMRWLMSGIPFVCYTAGIAFFARFGFTRADHARVRAELDARAEARAR